MGRHSVLGCATLGALVSLLNASTLCAEAKPKAGTYRDNGVIIKKNADGSIETFDTSDGPVTTIPAGASGSSSGSHSGSSTRNIGGVKVRKNSDGSIETSDTVDSYDTPAVDGGNAGPLPTSTRTSRPHAIRTNGSAKATTSKTSATSKSTSKTSSNRKANSTRASSTAGRKPSGGGVHVQKNADGSIETWD